ncbi:MAG: hypothetical protein H0X41_03125 [Chitinophagaceae bacterium]|nr:hypothetical protein [Chitinophagaceae bacterium]
MIYIAYSIFACMILFSISFVFWLFVDAFTNKRKTSIQKEFDCLLSAIKGSAHPVDISLLDNEISNFLLDHNGEREAKELYDELLRYAHERDVELKKELNKKRLLKSV